MAPRPPAARRTLGPHNDHIYDLGVVGRKTGVTVPDSGVRDEHGMEPLENLFSSPGKSDHEEEQEVEQEEEEEEPSDEDESGEQPMDITTTSGIGPAALLNGHASRLPQPMSRVRSPAKSFLHSPAQRNRLIARNSSSPARGAVVRNDVPKSSSQPTGDQSTKRRLDFQSVANGGPHSLSQPLSGSRSGTGKGLVNGHRLQPLQQDDDGKESDHGGDDDEVADFVEESMAMLSGGDDYDLPSHSEQEPAQSGGEEEISMVDGANQPTPTPQKKRGRPPKNKETAPARSAKPAKGTAKPVADEHDEDDAGHPEDEEEEPAPQPQKPAPGRRGRPPKTAKASPAPAQPPARPGRKRRSLDQDEPKDPSPEPQPKRQRTAPTAAAKPAPKKAAAAAAPPPPPPADKPKRGRKPKKPSLDAADAGDISQVSIPRHPPLPKSRGLLINRRREDESAQFRTRSGRTSFKPLAYWRNERVEFDMDEAEDAFRGRKRRAKFVLPSIKEVVRVDEPEVEAKGRTPRRGGGKRGGVGKMGRGRRRTSGGFNGDDEDDGPAEVWELDQGTVTGEVVVWQPEYEFSPPAPNDMVSVMDKQLAISGAAIKTTEVVGGEFRYAKVFSEGFIGAGVVDLPPGSIKRLKNSRKVFMIFFVHVGRVLVTVQETSFRISKGGIFIVPRYNEYTIENDYDRPARIFFSQGQEMTAKPSAEEEGGEEDVDGEEEVELTEGEGEASGEEEE